MSIPPLGLIRTILVWLYDQITRLLMRATYRESHERWAKRHRLGAHWVALGGTGIEYSVYFANPTDREPRMSRIAFRAVRGGIESLDVILEASGCGVRYQEPISLRNLNAQPVVRTLSSVPHLDIVQSADGKVGFTLDSFHFLSGIVRCQDGRTEMLERSLTHSFTQSWLLHDHWIRRWGHWWNCNEIEFAIGEIRDDWKFRTGLPGRPKSPIGWLMSSHWLATVQFWLAIWSGLYRLNDDGRLEPKWKNHRARAAVARDG